MNSAMKAATYNNMIKASTYQDGEIAKEKETK